MATVKTAPKTRQERARVTREKIFQAAIGLLGAGGARAVTHRAVAESAGVSLASTTYHFRDKAELLAGAFEWLMERYSIESRGRFEGLLKDGADPDDLTAYLVSISKQSMSVPGQRVIVCAWYEFMLEASRDPRLQETADNWYVKTCAHYEQILQRFNSISPKKNARRLVDFLIGYEFLALAVRPQKLGRLNMADTYARFVESLFDGPR